MVTSYKDDQDFITNVIGNDLLENSLSWIEENMSPEDVFGEEQLREWAEGNGYVAE